MQDCVGGFGGVSENWVVVFWYCLYQSVVEIYYYFIEEQCFDLFYGEWDGFCVVGFFGCFGGVKLMGVFWILFIDDDLIFELDGYWEDQNIVFVDKGFGKIVVGIYDQVDFYNYLFFFLQFSVKSVICNIVFGFGVKVLGYLVYVKLGWIGLWCRNVGLVCLL